MRRIGVNNSVRQASAHKRPILLVRFNWGFTAVCEVGEVR